MDDSTKQAVAQLAQAVPALVQTGINYRLENKRMEKQAEAEVRAAEVRHERMQEMGAPQPVTRGGRQTRPQERREPAPEREPQSTRSIEELKEGEGCSLCLALLDRIEPLEGSTREKALAEYGQLKGAMDEDADKDEIQSIIRETDVLRGLMEQELKE